MFSGNAKKQKKTLYLEPRGVCLHTSPGWQSIGNTASVAGGP